MTEGDNLIIPSEQLKFGTSKIDLPMRMKPVHPEFMRVLFIALAMLASTISIWAQGQIVEGGCAIQAYTLDDSLMPIQAALIPSSSDWVSPRTSYIPGDFSLMEASRVQNRTGSTFSPLPSFPPSLIVEASDFQPQAFSLTIQAVPEPGTFALLTVGLLTCAAISWRRRIYTKS